MVIKEFRFSIPRWHSRVIVGWLGVAPRRSSSLDQSTDHTHSTTHRQVVAVVSAASDVHQAASCVSSLRGTCVA